MKKSKAIAISIVVVLLCAIVAVVISTVVIYPPTKITDTFSISGKTWPKYYHKNKWSRILSFGPTKENPKKKFIDQNKIKNLHIKTNDDGSGINKSIVETILKFLDEGYENKEQILVHCIYGKNRSVSALAAYLAWKKKSTWEKAYKFIKSKRTVAKVNKNLKIKYIDIMHFINDN